MKFYVGIGRYTLRMEECASLKDKRRLVRSLLDRLGNSRMVAVSEVAGHDSWKTSTLGVVSVSPSMDLARKALEGAVRMIYTSGVEVIGIEQWYLKPEDLEG